MADCSKTYKYCSSEWKECNPHFDDECPNNNIIENMESSNSKLSTYGFITLIIICILLLIWYFFLYNIPRKALINYNPSNSFEHIMYPFIRIFYLIMSIGFFVYPAYIFYNGYKMYKN